MGEQALLNRMTVGIVESRNASATANLFIEELAQDLSKAGIAVISSVARYIYAAAHRECLKDMPIGVVATRINIVYPLQNADFQAAITANGSLSAGSPTAPKPTDKHFPCLSRISTCLASGLVLIKAVEQSDSLITARFALGKTREAVANPSFPSASRSSGGNRLIQEVITVVQSADNVLKVLHTPQPEPMVHPVKAKHPVTKALAPAPPTTLTAETEAALSKPKDRLLSALCSA